MAGADCRTLEPGLGQGLLTTGDCEESGIVSAKIHDQAIESLPLLQAPSEVSVDAVPTPMPPLIGRF